MFELNRSFIACSKRFKKDDVSIRLEDAFHFVHPFCEFVPPGFRMPNNEIGNTPARDNKISRMVWNWQLTMVGNIHLPVGESAGEETLAANAQHLSREVKSTNRSNARGEQQRKSPSSRPQI